jgi:DNA (cytosine-5)-methyltransferase 1
LSALGFYEFFAGGGMARAGLGPDWRCLFANDLDPMKARVYQENFGGSDFVRRDVALLAAKDLPGVADLAWASFPCQDLSLAGDQKGLGAEGAEKASRSGTFWPFWSLIKALGREGRAPALVVLENVLGVLTSSGGEDFRRLCQALYEGGYRYGAMVLDARRFLPQSRPRVFIIAVRRDLAISQALIADEPEPLCGGCPDRRGLHRRSPPSSTPRPGSGTRRRRPSGSWP